MSFTDSAGTTECPFFMKSSKSFLGGSESFNSKMSDLASTEGVPNFKQSSEIPSYEITPTHDEFDTYLKGLNEGGLNKRDLLKIIRKII